MDWHFHPDKTGSFSYKDPTAYTVSSQGSLTHLQIFVREVLQNSLDNATGIGPVNVVFRPLMLEGEQKTRFLRAVHFETLAAHLRSGRAAQKNPTLRDPDEIRDPRKPIPMLLIEDFGTRGLVGPETNREAHAGRFPKPHCFLGLCRNVGDSQKSDDNAGGTYGFGKSVLWKHSGASTVLFFSRMHSPYISPDGKAHDLRLFGQSRLPSHWIGDQCFRHEGYFGSFDISQELVLSTSEGNLEAAAQSLDFYPRGPNEAGTSILIFDMLDPDEGEPVDDVEKFASDLKDAAERFFWPAMVDGRLTVRCGTIRRCTPVIQTADPLSRADLRYLIPSYRAARTDTSGGDIKLGKFESEIPKGPSAEDDQVRSQVWVATALAEANGDSDDFRNRAALVRGSGMVVGYVHVPRRSMTAREFYSVVLGGRACPAREQHAQDRCERLLALAEPVTHDKWTDKSEQLKGWRGAASRIREIIAGINKSISDVTCDSVPPEGDAAPELAKLFPLDEPEDQPENDRDMMVEITNGGTRTSHFGKTSYEFRIKVRIPAKKAFSTRAKPSRWRVGARFAYIGDSKGLRPLGEIPVRFGRYRIAEGDWMPVESEFKGHAYFEGDVQEHATTLEISGRTAEIDSEVGLSYRYALIADSAKFVDEESQP